MNGHKSSLVFCYFLIFYILMAAGCALSPTLKRPENLPPTVKKAKVVNLSGNEFGMVDSGIYLNRGEAYSIVVAGWIQRIRDDKLGLGEQYVFDISPFLEIRIGQEPHFKPLRGTYYNLNGTTRLAPANGNLYLALELSKNIVGHPFRAWGGDVDVLIIVWKTDDRAQIVESLQKLKEDTKKSDAHIDFIKGFDDAIDRAKGLREYFGFRTLDPPCGIGFTAEIVCVKNYRRVTP